MLEQLIPKNTQIIFFNACRGIEDASMVKNLLEYEKFIINLNLYSETQFGINKSIVKSLDADLYPEKNSNLDYDKFLIIGIAI